MLDQNTTTLENNISDKKSIRSIKKGFLFFRALNHPIRQSIIDLIAVNGEMNVTNIQIKLRIDQAIVSQQLAVLREAKVVIDERRGQFIYYSLNEAKIAEALSWSENI